MRKEFTFIPDHCRMDFGNANKPLEILRASRNSAHFLENFSRRPLIQFSTNFCQNGCLHVRVQLGVIK